MATKIVRILSDSGLNKLIQLAKDAEDQSDFFYEADRLIEEEGNVVYLQSPIEFEEDLDAEGDKLKNFILVHQAIGEIDAASASNGRIWTTLAVYDFRDYMHDRWPLASEKWRNALLSRWIVKSSSRGNLIRQEISRMWWVSHHTFDPQSEFALPEPYDGAYGPTKWVVEKEDRILSIFDRSFSGDKNVLRSLVQVMVRDDSKDQGKLIQRVAKELRLEASFKELGMLGNMLPSYIETWKERMS